MLACTKQDMGVIRILIEHHADLKMVNKDKWNCFHIACRLKNLKIIYLLTGYSLCNLKYVILQYHK